MSAMPVHLVRSIEAAAALIDETRLQLVRELSQPDTAAGLARRLNLPRQRVNYHLRELERVGLVECIEERRKGNCTERLIRAVARSYLISPEVLGESGSPPADANDRFSSTYLVAAAARTIRDLAILRDKASQAGQRLPTMTMELEIRFASAADRNAFAEDVAHELTRLAAEYHDEQAPDGRTFRFVVGGYPKITRNLDEPRTDRANTPRPERSDTSGPECSDTSRTER